MGSEGRTGWARFRQPSVAERVLRCTKRPTLVVPSDDTGDSSVFENVVVAVDLSSASRALIDGAMDLLGRGVRRLTALHVVDSIEPASASRSRARWLVPEYRGHVVAEARRQLTALMQRVGTDVHPELRIAAESAAETIGAYAAEVNADLIVMGRIERFMDLGSTAVRILRNTERTLLIVPPMTAAQTIDAEQPIHTLAA
jgi:nucleotide-binding universal stress UspA family protein